MLPLIFSLQQFSDAEELCHDQLVLFARAIRTKLQVYFEHTPVCFAFITAIVTQRTGMGRTGMCCEPLKHVFCLSRVMLENDQNHRFKLFSEFLDVYLGQALENLLDDPQGEYFIDDNQYADIALNMINYISAEIECVLPIRNLGLHNDITFQVFSDL